MHNKQLIQELLNIKTEATRLRMAVEKLLPIALQSEAQPPLNGEIAGYRARLDYYRQKAGLSLLAVDDCERCKEALRALYSGEEEHDPVGLHLSKVDEVQAQASAPAPAPIPAHLARFDWYAPHLAWLDSQGLAPRHDPGGAEPKRADLRGADLKGTGLGRAILAGADLTEARLTRAHLTGACLRWANLTGADLRVTRLTGADLTGAILTRADLTGARLTGACLEEADLEGAIGLPS